VPRASVIIPSYNRREFVQQAIDSVLGQTYTDYEIIVIDDGSTDGTGEALTQRYGDRLCYYWFENSGVSAARNRGIARAQGDYVAFLDSDDQWLPAKLERQVAYLDEHHEVGAVFCQGWWMDEQGKLDPGGEVIGADITPDDLTLEALLTRSTLVIPGSTLVVRRELLERVGIFDEALHFGEDWDLCIRLRAQAPIEQVPEPLCRVRVHLGNQCRLRPWEKVEPALKDHLRLLEKGAALVPAEEPYLSLRRSTEAREYAEAGLLAMAWGHFAQGGAWLGEAMRRDPSPWREASRLGTYLVYYVSEVQHRTGALRPAQWGQLVDAMVAALPPEYDASDRNSFHRWMIWYLFFRAAERNDYAMLRWGYPRLLLADREAALRRDVVSKWLESLVGEQGRALAKSVKRLVRGTAA